MLDEAVRATLQTRWLEAIKTFDKLERLENMEKVETETHEHFADLRRQG